MLVRNRAQKRGPRKPVERTPPKSQKQKIAVDVQQMQSARKSNDGTKSNEMKVFRQKSLNTGALDTTYDRVGSVSPLKYRPRIDMEGLQEEDYYERKHSYDRRRLRTPDHCNGRINVSPTRSNRSLSNNARSGGKRSILKASTRSEAKYFD